MKLLILWPYELQSPNRARYQRIRTLSSKYDVILFTIFKSQIDLEIKKYIRGIIATPIENKLAYIVYPLLIFFSLLKIRFKNKDVKIYVFYNWTIILAIISSFIFRIKIFVDFLDDPEIVIQEMEFRGGSKLKIKIYKFINYIFDIYVNKSDKIFGFSAIGLNKNSHLPKLYLDRYSINPNNVIIIPNGSSLSFYNSFSKRKADGNIKIIFVTHIGPEKEIDVLINQLKKLKNIAIKLYLIGPIRNKSDEIWIKMLIDGLNWITYKGELPHSKVLKCISESDLGIFMANKKITNYRYTHPIKVMEYLAMGKPVIAPNFEGIQEIIENGYNGFTFDPTNPEGIVDIINQNKELILRGDLSENALESIKKFSWEKINKNFLNKYEKLYNNSFCK